MTEQPKHASPVAVLGAGSWGTAIAMHLAHAGQTVRLWGRDAEMMASMAKSHQNTRYLPDMTFPKSLICTASLPEALQAVHEIIIAVPSSGFRAMLVALKPYLLPDARLLWLTKGLDSSVSPPRLLHETALEILGEGHDYAVLSGPTFAVEVAAHKPASVVMSATTKAAARAWTQRFHHPQLRVFYNPDLIGVQLCGIIKNVLAVAAGLCSGMDLGANARAAMITRGMADAATFVEAMGGERNTVYGLAGLGDIILTCTSDLSRNHRFGRALGEGKSQAEARKAIGQVVESVENIGQVYEICQARGLDTPIIDHIHAILVADMTPTEAFADLMAQAPVAE